MLSNELRQTIQQAYRSWLASKSLGPRVGQRQMIADVANTLSHVNQAGNKTPIAVIEAGTGTGKTLAYSLAAIPLAQAKEKTLVISTATIALQEQIVFKDLPDILANSGLDFSFALAKGRGRYLCLSKLDAVLDNDNGQGTAALYPDEMLPASDEQAVKIYHSMADAVSAGEWDGDKDNWPEEISVPVWASVAANFAQCTGRNCSNVSCCYFFKARESLETMDVVVANHDLVLADLALGGGAILPEPEDAIYIFDEGHHLPDKALQHFTYFTRVKSNVSWLEQLSKSLLKAKNTLPTESGITNWVKKIPKISEELATVSDTQFMQLVDYVSQQENPEQERFRFKQGVVPSALQFTAKQLSQLFTQLVDVFTRIDDCLEDLMSEGGKSKALAEEWYPVFSTACTRAEGAAQLWRSYSASDADVSPMARWIRVIKEYDELVDFELCCSPVLAADSLQEQLWSRCAGAIVTSATMTALGDFKRFLLASGVPDSALFKVVPSSFDYQRAGVFTVPVDALDPSKVTEHTDYIVDSLPQLLADELGSLVLFSSRKQMEAVYDALPVSWREKILIQGNLSKQQLISTHKETVDAKQQSVLFGLASFAEGIDLPGKYCTHVVIAKLPFAVPDDPVGEALSEWVDERGGNAFMEISVPDAAQKLVQACGRLLRSEADQGTVTLLDRRIVSRRYGKAMLAALPPFFLKLN